MANIFISYNRQSQEITTTLANDIEVLGHTIWFDQQLSGGQTWWDQILATIRGCDVFVFVLDPAALNSTACKREYGYAADLGKPILPVLVSEGVSTNLLPPALSQIQILDYRRPDRHTALRLARAFTTVPPSKPLPDPLPLPPEAPISYLGGLTEQVETTFTLSYQQQSALVSDLRRGFRDPDTTDDTRTLLERLRKRHDLFATTAEEIDELLGSTRKESLAAPRASERVSSLRERSRKEEVSSALPDSKLPERQEPQRSATRNAPTSTDDKPTRYERMIGALSGALLGTVGGILANLHWTWWVLLAPCGAILGAITGQILRKRKQKWT